MEQELAKMPRPKKQNKPSATPSIIFQKKQEKKETKRDYKVDKDAPLQCKPCVTYQNLETRQLRYVLQYAIIEFNMERERRNPEDESKQILNDDEVIEFVCDIKKFSGKHLERLNRQQWADLLSKKENIDDEKSHHIMYHKPAQKIWAKLRDNRNVSQIPIKYLDLDMPFLFKRGIKQINESKFDIRQILNVIKYKKYDQVVSNRRKFVEMLQTQCQVAKGPSIKLHSRITKMVQQNAHKYYALMGSTKKNNENENENGNERKMNDKYNGKTNNRSNNNDIMNNNDNNRTKKVKTKQSSLVEHKIEERVRPKQRKVNKLIQRDCPIIAIINKYSSLKDLGSYQLREVINCCIDWINRQKLQSFSSEDIWMALTKKNNPPRQQRQEMKINSMQDCLDIDLFVDKVVNQCINQLKKTGKCKDNDASLGSQTNCEKLLRYLKSEKINGGNFMQKYPKKAKFSLGIFKAIFSEIQVKGMKGELIKLYGKICEFDYNQLSTTNITKIDVPLDKMKEMNGKDFIDKFEKNKGSEFVKCINDYTSIKNDQEIKNLYRLIDGFFNKIQDRNNLQFYLLLNLIINRKYGIKISNSNAKNQPDQHLEKLRGSVFIKNTSLTFQVFANYLVKSKIFNVETMENGIKIYDDLMELNFRLKGIKKLNECSTKNEMLYMMRKYVIPKFNSVNPDKRIGINVMIKYILENSNIDSRWFNQQNRKKVSTELMELDKNLKKGPLRKLCTHIDEYCVVS